MQFLTRKVSNSEYRSEYCRSSGQLAANEKGVNELHKMVWHYSLETVVAYMGHVQDNAEESVRRVIDN